MRDQFERAMTIGLKKGLHQIIIANAGPARMAEAKKYAEALIKNGFAEKFVEFGREYSKLDSEVSGATASIEILDQHQKEIIIIDEIYSDRYDAGLIDAVKVSLVKNSGDIFIFTGNMDMQMFLAGDPALERRLPPPVYMDEALLSKSAQVPRQQG